VTLTPKPPMSLRTDASFWPLRQHLLVRQQARL
jgi:hypothetical protein